MSTYKNSGVDVVLGDICSGLMAQAADRTLANRKGKPGTVKVLEVKGLHRILTVSLGRYRLLLNSDGIGTKIEIAERLNKHDTMAYDLFAMLCDDSVRYGAEPVAVSSILDMSRLDRKVVSQLAQGMRQAARQAGVAVVSGEIAELGRRIAGYGACPYNWTGTVLAVLKKEITGRSIRPGDAIIALKEKGFRSNGLSLVRRILENRYGGRWHTKTAAGKNLGKLVLQPSRIYTRAVLEMLDHAHGIVHVTGGGIPGKLRRILMVRNLGAELHDLFAPAWLMTHCQEIGRVSDEEAYRTWNMGQGMLIITDQPGIVTAIAGRHRIRCKIAGQITKEPSIFIKSHGRFCTGTVLAFS